MGQVDRTWPIPYNKGVERTSAGSKGGEPYATSTLYRMRPELPGRPEGRSYHSRSQARDSPRLLRQR